ncbi:hypothetical protein HBI24_219620 [Parastagonospora nodorum]|nr:hypothetical protein HBH97_125260 [Parastagonospora nodorum]KAH5570059.1 hypothetical protein HBI24_219620 [Parastagonospora nodorum]KAH5624428.1 hypothetical protein HBI22_165310 [Parastagonospora nodorum]KAH5810105.1 hypothetical protein HBI93_230920 [Parastagonospora nodorum]KAH5848043.1 hypothetical protein HBI91_207020 [Parastagonospora nodorum]
MPPIPDLRDPARWSSWGEVAASFNVLYMMCLRTTSESHPHNLDCYSPLLPIYPSSFLHQKSLTIPLCRRDSPLKT